MISFNNSFSQKVAVELELNNVLYIELENPIRIAAENISCKNLIVKTDNGAIAGENGIYICTPKFIGPANITIYTNQEGRLKKIKTLPFRVKFYVPIENIQFYFANCSNSCKMSKSELLKQRFVRAEVVNMDFDYKYPVDSFKVEIRYEDSVKIFNNIGNEINRELLNEFSLLKKDSQILFTDIHSHRPVTESIIILSPLKLIITE